jgi:hypothetical protein
MLKHILILIAVVTPAAVAHAQNNGQGGQGQGGNQFPGGILINPDGVVGVPDARRINPGLEQKRLQALASQQLPGDMTTASELRKVSLVRLEQEIQEQIDAGKTISAPLRYLAGITQLEYIFAIPETNDLVIAGPAEGFAALADGRVVGVETGRPVLTLDDLLVMLRLRTTNTQLGCSFDPDPTRLAAAEAWNRANSSPARAAVARQRFYQMANVLGNWDVTVFGLPPESHAAITTVEADFEMKRLALGLYKPAIRGFLSHLDLAKPGENTMRRWWFSPRYDVIERSADHRAFHLAGPRLQLLSQEELVDSQGNRSDAAFSEISTERYTRQFNKHMPVLCEQIPAFAGIQNLFDLAVAVALIRNNNLLKAVGWQPTLLLDEDRLPVQKYTVPRATRSLVNVKSARRGLLLGKISGGVTIVPDRVIARGNVVQSESLPNVRPPEEAGRHWWWD